MRVVVSEELKNGAEGITARVEHDVVVIPVKHIRTGHIPQARMKHIVLEHVFLRNTLHVIEILSVAHNEELELLNLRCMAGERTALLHQIGHDSFQHNRVQPKCYFTPRPCLLALSLGFRDWHYGHHFLRLFHAPRCSRLAISGSHHCNLCWTIVLRIPSFNASAYCFCA